jgi:hypothetical protein
MRKSLQALDKRCWRNDTVSIKPIETMDELIYAGYDCRLTEEQKDMVSPFWFTIGRAYLFPENHYPCIIYNEKSEAIGFINLCKCGLIACKLRIIPNERLYLLSKN